MVDAVDLALDEDEEIVYPTLEAAIAALGSLVPEGPDEADVPDGTPLEGEPDGGEG